MDDKSVSKPGVKGHIGIRTGHTTSIIASVKDYLEQHPAGGFSAGADLYGVHRVQYCGNARAEGRNQ